MPFFYRISIFISKAASESCMTIPQGKDQFRVAWRQDPIYSGGPIGSFQGLGGREYIACAFNHTLNIVDAKDGTLLSSFSLPLEDPILHVDVSAVAVSAWGVTKVVNGSISSTAAQIYDDHMIAAMHYNLPTIVPLKYDDNMPEYSDTVVSTGKSENNDVQSISGYMERIDTRRPRATAYVAISTEGLQVYILAVEVLLKLMEDGRLSSDFGKSVRLHVTQQWAPSVHAIGCLRFAPIAFPPTPQSDLAPRGNSFLIENIPITLTTSVPNYLATGSTDGNVLVWNINKKYLTHNLRHPQGGSLSCFGFSLPDLVSDEAHDEQGPQYFASGSFTGYVSLIKFSDKKVIGTNQSHAGAAIAALYIHLCSVTVSDKSGKTKKKQSESGHVKLPQVISIGRDRKLVVHQPNTLTPARSIGIKDDLCTASFFIPRNLPLMTVAPHHSLTSMHNFFQHGLSLGTLPYANEAEATLLLGNNDGSIAHYCLLLENTQSEASTETPNPIIVLRQRTSALAPGKDSDGEETILALVPLAPVLEKIVSTLFATPENSIPSASLGQKELFRFVVADYSQRLTFFSVEEKVKTGSSSSAVSLTQQYVLAGCLDDVLDIKPLKRFFRPGGTVPLSNDESLMFPSTLKAEDLVCRAVATNSKDVLIFDGPGCRATGMLQGHSDIVTTLSVSTCGEWLATGSKDNHVRLWQIETSRCIAVSKSVAGHGHSASISAVRLTDMLTTGGNQGTLAGPRLCASVGADERIFIWDCRPIWLSASTSSAAPAHLLSTASAAGSHGGGVFCACFDKTGNFLATGGKDKNIALWGIGPMKKSSSGEARQDIRRQVILSGHRRQVTDVVFSSVDPLLASASADGTLRLWTVPHGQCVKTFQADGGIGMSTVAFFNQGSQLIAGTSDGIVRVWAIGPGEEVASVDAHTDRIWSIATVEVQKEKMALLNDDDDDHNDVASKTQTVTVFLTGASDGTITAIEDFTAQHSENLTAAHVESVEQRQDLTNAIRRKEHVKAFRLALKLKHVRHLRQVVIAWGAERGLDDCEQEMALELKNLGSEHLLSLLEGAREMLTNARYSRPASIIIAALLQAFRPEELAQSPAVVAVLEALLGYSKRHLERVNSLLGQLWYLDWLTRPLRPAAGAAAATLTSDAIVTSDELLFSEVKDSETASSGVERALLHKATQPTMSKINNSGSKKRQRKEE